MIFKNIIYFRPTEQVREIFVVEFNFERCKQGKVFFFLSRGCFCGNSIFLYFLTCSCWFCHNEERICSQTNIVFFCITIKYAIVFSEQVGGNSISVLRIL